MQPDWTMALDDAMCERSMACLMCGQRQGMRSIDLVVVQGQGVLAVARCLRCVKEDKDGARLIARLAARESPPLKET